jgi:hypothetical protein
MVDAAQCPICLETLIVEEVSLDSTFQTTCGHRFHACCLQSSIRSGNYTCPFCRQPFGEISELTSDRGFSRYAKMLKSNLAPAAVRQRMIVDGIPAAQIDAFFTCGTSLTVGTPKLDETATLKTNTVEFDKYRKMLSVGMSEGAVRQKMSTGRINSEEIDSFFCDFYERLSTPK